VTRSGLATLQVCLACTSDDGGGTARVIDHLVGIYLEHTRPTSASAIPPNGGFSPLSHPELPVNARPA